MIVGAAIEPLDCSEFSRLQRQSERQCPRQQGATCLGTERSIGLARPALNAGLVSVAAHDAVIETMESQMATRKAKPKSSPSKSKAIRSAPKTGKSAKAPGTRLHCKLRHAVVIKPGLRRQFPENGSFPRRGRRLSANSPVSPPNREHGDCPPDCKSPPLVAFLSLSRLFSPTPGLAG